MEEQFKYEALFDSVIVEVIETEEEVYGTIIVPDLGKEKNLRGVIVAVGEGAFTVTGTFVKTVIEVGDQVILPAMGFTKIEVEGKEYLVGNEKQIIAKLRK
jgi:co-chaperonin GroES (HSP10)